MFEKKPFAHLVMPSFLSEDNFRKVKEKIKKLRFHEQTNDLFHFWQSASVPEFVSDLINTKKNLFESYFGPLSAISVHATRYDDTDYLLPHDDRLEKRKVAFMLYLTNNKTGALMLHPGKKILPKENLLVAFEVSDKSVHEVEEVINEQRYTVGGWFYAD